MRKWHGSKIRYFKNKYISNTFSDIGQIYLDGWIENNQSQINEIKKGIELNKIEFLGPI